MRSLTTLRSVNSVEQRAKTEETDMNHFMLGLETMGTHHNALDDALSQAQHALAILAAMRG